MARSHWSVIPLQSQSIDLQHPMRRALLVAGTFFLATGAVVTLGVLAGEGTAELGAAEIQAIAEGWQANRDAFQTLRCRFAHYTGTARSLGDAKSGRSKLTKLETYTWLVSGDKVFYASQCAQEVTDEQLKAKRAAALGNAKPGTSVMVTVPCLPHAHLENGPYGANYGSTLKSFNVFNPAYPDVAGAMITPFSAGIGGNRDGLMPGRLFGDALRGRHRARFLGEQIVEDQTVWKAELTVTTEPVRWYCELWPERGFLARVWDQFRVKPSGPEHTFHMAILDAKRCSNGAWFPMRTILVSRCDQKGSVPVEEYVVEELATHLPPRDEEFALTLAKDTQVSILGTSDYFYVGEPRTIRAEELPAIAAEAKKITVARAARFAAARKLPAAGSSRWGARFAALGGLILIASLLFVRWRRRRVA